MPYLKGDAPSQLDVYVPKITRAYITSRLESVQARWQLAAGWLAWTARLPARLPALRCPAAFSRAIRAQSPPAWTCAAPPPACPPAAQAVVLQGAGEDPLDNDEQLQARPTPLPLRRRACCCIMPTFARSG